MNSNARLKTLETFFVYLVSMSIFASAMKTLIVEHSIEQFLTLGFKSVTMDDISNSLGISKKTIYQHFSNKQELVEACVEGIFQTITKSISEIKMAAAHPIAELYEVKLFVMHFLKGEKVSPQYQLKKYYPDIFFSIRKKQHDYMLDSVIHSLEKGMEMGLFRANINPNFIARLYFNGMNGIKDLDLFPAETFSPNYLMESYLEYHLRAIVTEKGIAELNKFITSKHHDK